jgi:DMSO reductase anchor subunit
MNAISLIVFTVCLAFVFGLVLVGMSGKKANANAAEILKIYAERGAEPPQSVINALTVASKPAVPPAWPPPKTRGRHFADVARDVVVVAGAVGMAWWRAPRPGEAPEAFMILALVVALIFAADAVWHFVAAYHTGDGK